MLKKLIYKIFIEIRGVIAVVVGGSVMLFHKKKLRDRYEMLHSPIFIIGAPRTGSTILYQALTNYYDVKYIDNLAGKWYRNLFFGMWLSDRKFGDTPHDNFKAKHGNTEVYGEHAPSECGRFWYRWLPKSRHFVDHGEISDKAICQMREEVGSVTRYFNSPLLFKNLNAGQRLRLIKEVFPDARFIYIRRDPRFVVRSIMGAKKNLGLDENDWWSIKPRNFEKLAVLNGEEMCFSQVFYIEKQIECDLELFPSENVLTVHYQNLNEETIDRIGKFFLLSKRRGGSLPKFKKDKVDDINDDVYRLNKLVERFDFDKESFC